MNRAPVLLLVLCGCVTSAPKPSPRPERQYSFAGLQGQHLKVDVVDVGRLFDSSPAVLTATKQAAEQQLSSHGVVIDDGAPRRLVLSLAPPDVKTAYSAQSCVQVTGRLETTAQAFLPTEDFSATRCGGRSPGAGPADPVMAIFALIGAAVSEANGASDRELAAGLSEALTEVLGQLDSRGR
jgi:hypothetical protein